MPGNGLAMPGYYMCVCACVCVFVCVCVCVFIYSFIYSTILKNFAAQARAARSALYKVYVLYTEGDAP